MLISIENGYSSQKSRNLSIYVENKLDGSDYDRGVVEEAQRTSQNCAEAIGQLCEILVEKDVLSLQDVVLIATGIKDYDILTIEKTA